MAKSNSCVDGDYQTNHIADLGISLDKYEQAQKFKRLRHNFDDILGAMDDNENDIRDLTPENQELLRATVCRFAPKKDDGFAHYGKFCGSQNGGQDYSKLR